MSRSVGMLSLCMCFAAAAGAQDVAICYDAGLPTLGLNDAAGFAQMLVDDGRSLIKITQNQSPYNLCQYRQKNPDQQPIAK